MAQFRRFYARISTLILFRQGGKKSLHFDFNGLVVTDHLLLIFRWVKCFIIVDSLYQFREVVFGNILT